MNGKIFCYRLLVITALMVLACAGAAAQEPVEAEYPYKRDMEKGNFDKVETRILKKLSKDSSDIESYYAAFQLYSHPAFGGRDVERAYYYLVRAHRLYIHADPKMLERLARDSYSGALFDNGLRQVGLKAIGEAHRRRTVDAYQHYLDYYAEVPTDLRDSMVHSRDTLEFRNAREAGTVEMLQEFIDRRPKSLVKGDAIRMRDSMAFEEADRVHAIAAYDGFRKKYPESHLYSRATDSIYTLDFRDARNQDQEQYYRAHAERYPESPFAVKAVYLADSIEFYRITVPSDWHSYIAYLDEHPDRGDWSRRATAHLTEFATLHRHLEAAGQTVKRMAADDPGRSRLATMLHQAYMHTTVRNYPRFYAEFPNLMSSEQRRHDSLAYALNENYHYHIIDSCIRGIAPYHDAYTMLLQLLKDDIDHQRWEAASDIVKRYAGCFGDDADYHSLLATLQAEAEPNLKAVSVGKNINTPTGDEYSPVVSADDKTMYFTGKKRADNLGGEDIYVARKTGNAWGKATLMMDLSHTYGNEAPVSVSADGTTLLLFQGGVLYQAEKSAEGWYTPQRLPSSINNSSWQADASLASNGQAMLFAAYSRTDRDADSSINIFVSLRDEQGNWGAPFEIGPAINTPFDDRSPVLHSDMKTLYFCSEGHGAMGQMDVFVSTRLKEDSWTEWSEPVNIGKEINTTQNDCWYKIATDGSKAYFSRNNGSQDIFWTPLPKRVRPQAVSVVTGTVRGADEKGLATEIYWEEPATGRLLGRCKSDPANGRYFMVLPQGKSYRCYVHDSLFYPAAFSVTLEGDRCPGEIVQNLQPASLLLLSSEATTVTPDIAFGMSGSELTPEAEPELARLAALIKQYDLSVEVGCHMDGAPTDSSNVALTERRAAAVRQRLMELGCKGEKIKAVGYGSSVPAPRGKGEKARPENRRTEVKLTKAL